MKRSFLFFSLCLYLGVVNLSVAQESPSLTQKFPSQIAIATSHYLATQTVIQVLAEGGNAFDAAVATAAILGVVQPYGSGVGGGGLWLLHDAKTGKDIVIDSREVAPRAADNAQLEDKNSHAIFMAGIPGEPAAWEYITKNYAKLSLAKLLAPAIHYAQNGFAIDDRYLFWLATRQKELFKNPAAQKIFFTEDEEAQPKLWVVQNDLANTLKILSKRGAKEFYQGALARRIVSEVKKLDGDWTLDDLKNYQLKIREPIKATMGNFSLITIGEPSAGGYEMIAMLQGLQGYTDWQKLDKVDQTHLFAELMRRASYERKFYTDPEFDQQALPTLKANRFYPNQPLGIDLQKATPSAELATETVNVESSEHTTFFVIVDKEGNRVAAHLTLNNFFGSGLVLAGTGIVLNDELRDFTAQSDSESGKNKNAIAGGKRPLSSMAASFYEDACRLVILGTPGGQRIPAMQFLSLSAMLQNSPITEWVSLPRFSQSFMPDVLEIENQGWDEATLEGLRKKGHEIKNVGRQFGDMQAVSYNRCTQRVAAASDPRGVGFAVVLP